MQRGGVIVNCRVVVFYRQGISDVFEGQRLSLK